MLQRARSSLSDLNATVRLCNQWWVWTCYLVWFGSFSAFVIIGSYQLSSRQASLENTVQGSCNLTYTEVSVHRDYSTLFKRASLKPVHFMPNDGTVPPNITYWLSYPAPGPFRSTKSDVEDEFIGKYYLQDCRPFYTTSCYCYLGEGRCFPQPDGQVRPIAYIVSGSAVIFISLIFLICMYSSSSSSSSE